MDIQNLIKMANQIGAFFASYPDAQEASSEIANHLKKFWAPGMRKLLLDHVDVNHGDGLDAIVLSAIHTHRRALEPSTC
ncbi:formate dehydrogenase subunit delta [Noviherbaspirillum sedimenti]|uniref:Formate dehydrogenase n=1 Tax=Noviherbaspirillum sedimenti TaxID=2320865 RepID=A0A3A3GJZ0_9BURK|nr:formate dehydrogenase subunit delta [Noviherbaspirillum sedimenti]RJG02616.1 formate dehydrogenase [Noviherbaspirillum sedimenti]